MPRSDPGAGASDRSLLFRFFTEGTPDRLGRTLDDILSVSDFEMEKCHDQVQWMFPLHEASAFAQVYEVVTEEDAAALQASPEARAAMLRVLARFRSFLGLAQPQEPSKFPGWAQPFNHNLLRITRAIRSLRLFGLEEEAQAFHRDVVEVASRRGVPQGTLDYWKRAAQDPPFASMRGGGLGSMPFALGGGGVAFANSKRGVMQCNQQ